MLVFLNFVHQTTKKNKKNRDGSKSHAQVSSPYQDSKRWKVGGLAKLNLTLKVQGSRAKLKQIVITILVTNM